MLHRGGFPTFHSSAPAQQVPSQRGSFFGLEGRILPTPALALLHGAGRAVEQFFVAFTPYIDFI